MNQLHLWLTLYWNAQFALNAHFIQFCTNSTYCSFYPVAHQQHLLLILSSCAPTALTAHFIQLCTNSTYCSFYPVVHQQHLLPILSCTTPTALTAHFILYYTNSTYCPFYPVLHQQHLLPILSSGLANTIKAVLHDVQCETISFLNITQVLPTITFKFLIPQKRQSKNPIPITIKDQ